MPKNPAGSCENSGEGITVALHGPRKSESGSDLLRSQNGEGAASWEAISQFPGDFCGCFLCHAPPHRHGPVWRLRPQLPTHSRLFSGSREALPTAQPSSSQDLGSDRKEVHGTVQEEGQEANGQGCGVWLHWVRGHRRAEGTWAVVGCWAGEHGIGFGLEESPMVLCGPGQRASGGGRGAGQEAGEVGGIRSG